jgi:hypothetical protein
MKKVMLFSILCCLLTGLGYAQNITLTFLGQDAITHSYMPLDSVYIKNTTLGCDTVIYGDPPSIVITCSLGIDDPVFPSAEPFIVMPPVPNPFDGMTHVQIKLNQEGKLNLKLSDQAGKIVSEFENDFPVGLHRFEINSSMGNFFVLTVSNNNLLRSVKLICNSSGMGRTGIQYLGTENRILKASHSTTGFLYQIGNQLLFKSIKNGFMDEILFGSPEQNSSYTFQLNHAPDMPVVIITAISDLAQNTATAEGEVTFDGGGAVTARGMCWSTSPIPSLADNYSINGSGTGSFTSNLTNLDPSTLYYFRAYATNITGTAYSEQQTFTTLPVFLPVVITTAVVDFNENSATGGGDVASDGGSPVTARGVCWSTSEDPTIEGNHTSDGFGTGTFISLMNGLMGNTLYYVRAYAMNNAGIAYGNQVSFTTVWACIDPFTINHLVSGGVAPVNKSSTYHTAKNLPGDPSKCWITNNLGSDGQASEVNDATEASAGWYWQFNRKQGYMHDGVNRIPSLEWITAIEEDFQWAAINDPCTLELGTGWRLPTNAEWTNIDLGGGWGNWYGPWNSPLKMHAAGVISSSSGELLNRGLKGYYWSSMQDDNFYARGLYFGGYDCMVDNYWKANGMSVRCIHE